MPGDDTLQHLAILNNGEIPQHSCSCTGAESLRFARIAVATLHPPHRDHAFVAVSGFGGCQTWRWLGAAFARVVGPEGLEPPTKAL